MNRRNAGFSLLEVIAVVGLISVISSVAVIQMRTTIKILAADAASNTVVTQLNYARNLAVDERRNVLVEFLNTREIKVTRNEIGGGTTVMSDVTLPSGYTWGLPTGVGDTPDGFNAAMTLAVNFNAATFGTFQGDGTFLDNASVLLNGTVFTTAGGNGSVRAVTLSGATGRVKQYWIQGTTWIVR